MAEISRSPHRSRLDDLVAGIRTELGGAHAAREIALPACRSCIRHASLAIRAIHRLDPEAYEAERALSEADIRTAQAAVAGYPSVAQAGFLHDAEKEYAEAVLARALVDGAEIPSPSQVGVMPHSWMRGLAEAASELRRHVLDRLRGGELDVGELLLTVMDDVYDTLASVDLPDALTGGLRRTVDSLRAVTERTRGDVTTTVLQARLQAAITSASAD